MVSLNDYCFQVSNSGNNAGNGNDKRQVRPIPFGERLKFVVNPKWAEVAEYLPTSNHIFYADFAEATSSRPIGLYMTAIEKSDFPGVYEKVLGYISENESYTLTEGAESWVDRNGNPVEDLTIMGTVSGFSNDQYSDVLSIEDMPLYPGVLESYRTFSRIFNVSVEAMGDDLYDPELRETLSVLGGQAFPVANRAYIVRPIEKQFYSELSIILPVPESIYADDSITFNVHVDELGAPIAFSSMTGGLYTYNGEVIDLTEVGHYRVIATWDADLYGWCLSYAKMEEPS